jgi:polar amino acid transport system ATP-binding protein
MATEAAIEVRGLHKSYGENEAVRGIDFEVAGGEVLRLPRPERRWQDDHD